METAGAGGVNWLADLARAVHALGPDAVDGATLDRIAGMLGLERAERPGGGPAATPAPPGHAAVPSTAPPPRAAPPPGPPRAPGPPAEGAGPGLPLLDPVRVRGPAPGKRAWSGPALAGQEGPTAPGGGPAGGGPPVGGPGRPLGDGAPVPAARYRPLLPPRSEAAILHTLCARVVPEGPVDVDRLLEELARGTAPAALPRQPVRTLRFGVQVLIDLGPGMQPFHRDQDEIRRRIAAVAGRHACQVRYFADCPLRRSGPGPGWTWQPYRPPATGTRVLVLSDFGVHTATQSAPSRVEDWREFAAGLHRHGCPLTALAPVPAGRLPGWLTALMPVLVWDRGTTATQARAVLW
ncbi:hypothetical protein WDH52_05500 [Streptomyces sp. TRM70308]|uniref:hypothetical protein n=1 Tax=Streptomyces sp. TRM70308 TaxID=3131932 RepID=UPI003D06701F